VAVKRTLAVVSSTLALVVSLAGVASASNVVKIGQAFQLAQFRIVTHSFKCGIHSVKSSYETVTAQGQFCRLTMTATNTSMTPGNFNFDDASVTDSKGYSYAWGVDDDITADSLGNENVGSGFGIDGMTLNPHTAVTGNIYFEVPQSVRIAKINFTDEYLMSVGQKIVI